MRRDIRSYYGFNQVDADLGIEVEIETDADTLPTRVTGWLVEDDGSLRGTAAEYITKPIKFSAVESHLFNLRSGLKRHSAEVKQTVRAGVHVHLNIQDYTFEDLKKIMVLYSIFERSLLKFCGKNREENLFCLPLIDSEWVINSFQRAVDENNWGVFDTDNIRYCALNLSSIGKHGTLEFRSMETRSNLEGISEWVGLLEKLKDKADAYEDASLIMEEFSMSGPEEFMQTVFDDLSFNLIYDDYELGMLEGMRYAQDILHAEVLI